MMYEDELPRFQGDVALVKKYKRIDDELFKLIDMCYATSINRKSAIPFSLL